MTDVNKLIFEIWKPAFEQQLQHHPDRRTIMERLSNGDFTGDDVDRWFTEASTHSFRRMLNNRKKHRSASTPLIYIGNANGSS